MANDTKVILKFDGKEYELPLVEGSEKERAIRNHITGNLNDLGSLTNLTILEGPTR